jgi:hypothetical protein
VSLADALHEALRDPRALSHQLLGEDLVGIPPVHLKAAAASYERDLDAVPSALRRELLDEHGAAIAEAHAFLRRYGRSLHTRVAGYVELGRRLRFDYPWPVSAVLGLCQVFRGVRRAHAWALLGDALTELGWPYLSYLSEGTHDVLYRTNRGIFCDSVPTVLWALRADGLRARGKAELAAALLDGPLPLSFDQDSRRLARAIYDVLATSDGDERLQRGATLTLIHFEREQRIFSYHLGPPQEPGQGSTQSGPPPLIRSLMAIRRLSVPVITPAPRLLRMLGRGQGPRVRFGNMRLPHGFDLRDHEARVAVLGRAFISEVTGDRERYRAAVEYVLRRFGRPGERVPPGMLARAASTAAAGLTAAAI